MQSAVFIPTRVPSGSTTSDDVVAGGQDRPVPEGSGRSACGSDPAGGGGRS